MPKWDEKDQALAKAAQAELKVEQKGLATAVSALQPPAPERRSYGSDDIAEVGWNVPTVVLRYPGNIPGMIGHHWSSGIAMATPIAHKGSTAGAMAQAMTVIDLLMDDQLLQRAKAAFAEQTKTARWQSLIPAGTEPPVHMNRERMERFRPQLDKLRYDPEKYKSYLEQLGVEYPTLRRP